MYMTHEEANTLEHLIENILEDPDRPIFEDPEAIQFLKSLQPRLTPPDMGKVEKFRQYAEEYYGSDTDDGHQIVFDDNGDTWLTEGKIGVWVSCWAWVPREDIEEQQNR